MKIVESESCPTLCKHITSCFNMPRLRIRTIVAVASFASSLLPMLVACAEDDGCYSLHGCCYHAFRIFFAGRCRGCLGRPGATIGLSASYGGRRIFPDSHCSSDKTAGS